jgi:hypothetical protein
MDSDEIPAVQYHLSRRDMAYVPDASIIFSFLIIFLGVFGSFLVCGLVWFHVRRRQRALLAEQLAEYQALFLWHDGKPQLWNMWLDESEGGRALRWTGSTVRDHCVVPLGLGLIPESVTSL